MKKSYLVLHTAVILAGFTGIFGKLISLNEGLLVWYRLLFSAIILLLFMKIFRVKSKMTFRDQFNIAKVGLLIMLHWLFFYASIKYANISVGVVCYCLTSFFTAVFAPLINAKKFNITELLLSLLTIFGIALIFHFDASFQLGIVLGIISSAFGALYTIFNERLVKQYNSIMINYYQMVGGTIILGIFLPLYLYYFPVLAIVPSATDSLYLFLLASFCTVGLYVLFAESLRQISAFTVNLSFNLEPVYAISVAVLFFDESKELNVSFYIGLIFVMSAVLLQTVFSVLRTKKNKAIMQHADRVV